MAVCLNPTIYSYQEKVMASINKVIIVGNLGRDPENRYLPSGEQVTSIAVATTDRWRDKATVRAEGSDRMAPDFLFRQTG